VKAFGLAVGKTVRWTGADEDIPSGSTGQVVGFLGDRVRVQFYKGIFKFKPAELQEATPFAPKNYRGTFDHPNLFSGESVAIEVTMESQSFGDWTTVGQTERIQILWDGKKVRMMDSDTELCGEETSEGILEGYVIQDGTQGGSFQLKSDEVLAKKNGVEKITTTF